MEVQEGVVLGAPRAGLVVAKRISWFAISDSAPELKDVGSPSGSLSRTGLVLEWTPQFCCSTSEQASMTYWLSRSSTCPMAGGTGTDPRSGVNLGEAMMGVSGTK